ncbi:hypothetical protein BJ138DRAFT_1166647 [Hygrophoropsis aurantiaca]|uniref:Uncharacterized protein n=1 Tax=Hygrophoropsis aurantiaca TaxID=72124 RepID=A0ACB7ZT84_9AGAM|nr:hypothetical protein BJ138DRAFT_1166647 [Hygrophoropsis aurantiaca]
MLQKEMPRFSGTKLKYADRANISSASPSRPCSGSRSGSSAVSDRSFATDPPSEDNMSSSDLEKPIATHYRKRPAEINQDTKKSTKSWVSAPGKRELARNIEKPKWKEVSAKAPSSDATLSDLDSDAQASVNPTGRHLGKHDEAELQWPESCRLQYNDDGKVNLNAQKPHIQSMLRDSISELHKYILFENAHPSYKDKPKITADLLLSATERTGACMDVRKRLKKDPKYVRALAAVPEGRVSTFRGAFLTAAMKHVMPSYGLRSGPELKKAVAALLENDTYIYPSDEKGQPNLSKPLQNVAIVEVIKEVCFENDTCPGVKFHSEFSSTLDDRPDERELPPPIIALAATAVHAALLHLVQPPTPTGAKAAKPDINSYFYAGIYAAHTEILTELFRQSERKYHVMMFQYYQDALAGYRFDEKSTANSNIRRINWAAMPEE